MGQTALAPEQAEYVAYVREQGELARSDLRYTLGAIACGALYRAGTHGINEYMSSEGLAGDTLAIGGIFLVGAAAACWEAVRRRRNAKVLETPSGNEERQAIPNTALPAVPAPQPDLA